MLNDVCKYCGSKVAVSKERVGSVYRYRLRCQNPECGCFNQTYDKQIEAETAMLRPCPFCGSEHIILRDDFGKASYALCVRCGARTTYCESHEDAIEEWNMTSKIWMMQNAIDDFNDSV